VTAFANTSRRGNLLDLDQAEYVIQRGNRAADLLANESFTWIVSDLTNTHLAGLCAAKPGEQDAINYHHAMQHTLTEIVGVLSGYAQAGAAQQAVLDAINGDGEDELEDTP